MIGFIGVFDTAGDYTLQFTVTHTLVSTVTSSLPLFGTGFQPRTSLFLWVPELSPASATSFTQQQLTPTAAQRLTKSKSKSHCDWRSVGKSWCRAPSGAHDQIFITIWQLRSCSLWDALSDERMGLSFVHAAGPCQRSLSRARVHWDSRPYFTPSNLRLPFSSPPTTRRVTVEVFDPASTRIGWLTKDSTHYIALHGSHRKHNSSVAVQLLLCDGVTYSVIACTAIGTNWADNIILLLFTGSCLVTAGCCDSTVLASSEYATLCYVQRDETM
jgi:hypothetical protein